MIAESIITCPRCGTAKSETMPLDACQFFYDCTGCGALLRPKQGHCCVFCSFGDVACPPIQEAKENGTVASCCGAGIPVDAAAELPSIATAAQKSC